MAMCRHTSCMRVAWLRLAVAAAACCTRVMAETGCTTIDGTACLDTFKLNGQTNSDGPFNVPESNETSTLGPNA